MIIEGIANHNGKALILLGLKGSEKKDVKKKKVDKAE